ncbi:hypothetical protein COSHB9_21110 [Companilactobacillus alimentarius]|uniref:Uncharacterized protein n=1 Tax=Companilactobacillus alimentarius DSM 20249 TaxID=1423720 RepID=A0A2K9HJJ8_9LACO|nr:hypothetical protein [Companilactobacillus alimentarius]AUI72714.1 hypothetical protein LA20249_11175 [Companilactobacillus alimentarius DSM 20249]KRK75594.1 hypothetical protein FC67_GL001091 [Companilactobacillus alimentarius DSM 20249]MDT6952121.1 hypothetical protein [Companilactobacillus alimentarius]GEO45357.1 hypothetical protein LAL01_15890 [Companilactobacillus alimentarius]
MESIDFGRKINYVPMAISWGVGLIAGILIYIFTRQALLAVILGVAILVVVALVYAKTLSDFYGYWSIDDKGITSFNYQNFNVRFQSVLLTFSEDPLKIEFKNIKSLKVVVGKDMNAPANILGGSFNAPKRIMFHLPTPYYLELQLNDGREIYLDLSADWDDTQTIQYVIGLIMSKANIEASIVKQAQE